jgi:hypothetical protein
MEIMDKRSMSKRMDETFVAGMFWVFLDDHLLVLHLERLEVGKF